MNIQIFGGKKCFDTKKAQRYFKERRVKFQDIDLKKIGISRGELTSVISAVGLDNLVDPDHPDAALLGYLADNQAKIEHILEDPAPSVYLTNYGDSSIEYTVYCWATPENYWDVYFALGERLRETFAAHGVEMTYDHLNVHIVENRT